MHCMHQATTTNRLQLPPLPSNQQENKGLPAPFTGIAAID